MRRCCATRLAAVDEAAADLQRVLVRAFVDAASGKYPAAVAWGLRLLECYGPTENEPVWDLSVLGDDELDALEKLISKISVKDSSK